MCNSINEEKLAVECGYTLLMRYKDNKLYLDSKEPNFDKYEEFLNNEVRYNALKIKDNSLANKLLNIQINNAKERYNYYNKIKSTD
jgi:pyruvate-ferredoxin/flavodoxin oxidoreductase